MVTGTLNNNGQFPITAVAAGALTIGGNLIVTEAGGNAIAEVRRL